MAPKRPLIAEIHVRIQAASWSDAQRQLEAVLRHDHARYQVLPLYMTSDVEETELRICLEFRDPRLLEAFAVNEIRGKVQGILGTRVRLTLNGEIFSRGVLKLITEGGRIPSCHIFISVFAGKDDEVWASLKRLPEEDGVVPTWLFRDFYEYDRDLTVRLVGGSTESFRRYAERHLSNIPGIRCWRMQFIDTMIHIASQDVLQSMASHWLASREATPLEV